MPNYLKAIISLLVAATAAAAYFSGIQASGIALLLAALMIFAIWLFPEAGGKKGLPK